MSYDNLGYNNYLQQDTIPKPDLGSPDSIDLSTLVDGRLSDYVTGARNYDAVCSQDTTGDYRGNNAIQQALDDGKKNILVRNGTYEISSAINITESEIEITGESLGGRTKIKMIGSADDIIYIDGNPIGDPLYGIHIKNLNFFNESLSGRHGVNVENGIIDSVIDNCQFLALDGSGIYKDTNINYITNLEVKNCYFATSGGSAIDLKKGYSVSISRNQFDLNTTSGINFDGINESHVLENNFSNNGDTPINLTGTSTKNIVSHNIIDVNSNAAYGIRENSSADDYNIITSNIVENANTASILNNGANSVVANNI